MKTQLKKVIQTLHAQRDKLSTEAIEKEVLVGRYDEKGFPVLHELDEFNLERVKRILLVA